ncbi:MAG: ABC transporter ATP-binding protein [Betaproteobacteria bacterium]|jgi:multiple sugar transport system ATP-binding protein
MASLRLHNVAKRFGTSTAIHGADLEVRDGEFVVFVGPSGCGKSTLLRMICGLESVSGGDVFIGERRVNDVPAAQRGLAMVFQSYALYPHMTVRQNLAFGLENLHTPAKEIEARVGAAAKMLRLDTLLERRPTQLSGGQRQRVAIGRAIVREPAIFLFDEPLSNLDAELRVAMRNEITALHRRLATTMIYVTHDQVEAMTMADRIVVLRAGRIEQIGEPLTLYNHPANRFVAGFIGSPQMNFLDGRVDSRSDAGARLVLNAAPDRASPPIAMADAGMAAGPICVGIRPEHVELDSTGGAELELPVTIERVEQLGTASFVYARASDRALVTIHVAGQRPFRAGDALVARLPIDRLHVFEASEPGRAITRCDATATLHAVDY